MFDLFRFMLVRPPEATGANDVISIDGESQLRVRLADAYHTESPQTAMQKVAQDYIQSDDFVRNPSSLNLSDQLLQLNSQLVEHPPADLKEWHTLIERIFDSNPQTLVRQSSFHNDKRRLEDSLIAIKLAPPPQETNIEQLIQFFRILDLIERTVQNNGSLNGKDTIQESLSRLIALPADFFPVVFQPVKTTGPTVDPAQEAREAQRQQELLKQATDLKEVLQALGTANIQDASVSGTPGQTMIREATSTPEIALNEQPIRHLMTTDAKIAPRPINESMVTHLATSSLQSAIVEQLSPSAKATLLQQHINLSTTPLVVATQQIRSALGNTLGQIIIKAGAAHVHLPDLHLDPVEELPEADEAADPAPPVLAALPSTHGQIQPAGIADLLVVRQHLLRYEAGEVAYIENVSKGESFKRETQRRETTEVSTLTETLINQEQERDLQSTERFDLQRESENIVRTDTAKVPGNASSESYGALVESGGFQQSKQNQATTYGRDVTSRAASKVAESTRTQVIQRTTSMFEEKTEHAFNNSQGQSDEIVVYQWIDRIYQAQIFNYGKRFFYDIIVPEPSTFLLRALANSQPGMKSLRKPAPFKLDPEYIDEINYSYYIAGYGVTGVEPPPDQTIVVPKVIDGQAQKSSSEDGGFTPILTTQSTELSIPDGYQAARAVVILTTSVWSDQYNRIDVIVGQHLLRWLGDDDVTNRSTLSTHLNGEIKSVPVAVLSEGSIEEFSVAIEIICERTDKSFQEWQLKAHDAILQASRDRLAEYEERLANLQAALKLQVFGQSVAEKRMMERVELKKACIAILSNQQYDAFNAIEHSSQGYPQPFLPNVEPVGRYIRFFEQAFEWEQMMFIYYPYFWGRKKYWIDRVLLSDQDQEFAEFLRAGAARVLVPVRPGFEAAVTHFMDTGVVPTTAALTRMSSPLYIPILNEMLAGDSALEDGVPYDEPWEVRLPTTLIKLNTHDTLPRWKQEKNAQGKFVWTPDLGDPLE